MGWWSDSLGKETNIDMCDKGQEVVESHDCLQPERTRHIKEDMEYSVKQICFSDSGFEYFCFFFYFTATKKYSSMFLMPFIPNSVFIMVILLS